jgi:hypothetical protein
MRTLIPLIIMAGYAAGALAQTLPTTAIPIPSAASAPADAPIIDCAGLLTQAKDKQLLAAAMLNEKRWSDALSTYVQAEKFAQNAASGCSGSEQAEATALISKLTTQIGQTSDQRQRIEICRPAFDKALALDLKAASAKNQKLPIAEVEKIFSAAETAWNEAATNCRGKDQARAKASLADSAAAHAAIRETGSAGSECDDAWRNAEKLADVASTAWKERRWTDAAMLYRKTAMSWDVAEEQCETGERHEQAAKKRDSSESDAHNAMNCAPYYGQALDIAQKFKVEGSALNSQERGQMSMQVELVWRELAEHCQGAARDTAKRNADAFARERGTPLTLRVNKIPPTERNAPPAVAKVAPAPVTEIASAPSPAVPPSTTRGGAPTATTAAGLVGASSVATSVASVPSVATTVAAVAKPAISSAVTAPTAAPAKAVTPPVETTQKAARESAPVAELPVTVIKAGDVTYEGQFKVDGGAQTVTGSGTVRWSNGNTFTGSLVKSQENGKGKLTYANGQVYDGDWVDGKGTGSAEMLFPNGNKYAGKAVDGKPDGVGKMVSANGDVFEGMFKDGRFEGKGKFRWASGDTYDGEWANGKPHGRGEYFWSSGERAVGIYKDGVKID